MGILDNPELLIDYPQKHEEWKVYCNDEIPFKSELFQLEFSKKNYRIVKVTDNKKKIFTQNVEEGREKFYFAIAKTDNLEQILKVWNHLHSPQTDSLQQLLNRALLSMVLYHVINSKDFPLIHSPPMFLNMLLFSPKLV